jgi:hypothetical protein
MAVLDQVPVNIIVSGRRWLGHMNLWDRVVPAFYLSVCEKLGGAPTPLSDLLEFK